MTTMDEPSVSYQSYRKQRSAWTGFLRRFRDWLSLVVLHSCFRFLSLSSAQTLGKGVGRLAYRLLAKDRGIARKNLAIAYPQQPLATREQWVKECFQHYGQFLFEFLLLHRIKEQPERYLQVRNAHILTHAYAQNQGVILLGLHFGNWEYVTPYMASRQLPFHFITKNYAQNGINKLVRNKREDAGVRVILREQADTMQRIYTCLEQHEILYVLIDQDTRVASMHVPYFGLPAKSAVTVLHRCKAA